jgi:thioredoxin 1
MKDILIVFIVALVLGSVVNGMPPATNNSQPAQLAPVQANSAQDIEDSGGQTDASLSLAPIPLESANDSSFQNLVLNQNLPVLVDFYKQEDCPICKRMEALLGSLANEYSSQLKIVKVDVFGSPELSLKYGVASVPAFVLFDQGKPVVSLVGEMPKRRLMATIKPYLTHQESENSGKMPTPTQSANPAG